jgi:predicted KAP-like P-loop ATPase
LQRDHNLAARIDLLEQKVQEDFLKGLVTMQLDFKLEDRFKLFSNEFETLQKEVNKLGDKVSTLDP